ncbi:MAG: putative signal transducing protein [Fibrobacterota bacterium]
MSLQNRDVSVAVYYWIHEAETASAVLRSNGIDAYIDDGGITVANPLLATSVGGIRVMVAAGDSVRARGVLHNMQISPEDRDEPWCPHCGSTDVALQRDTSSSGAFLSSLLTLGLNLLLSWNNCTCRKCGRPFRRL